MPLPPPAPRQTMHHRRVQFTGYQRQDGLWDIEAELLDSKPHAFEIEGEGAWAPNEPIHHMHIRLTIDEQLVVRDIAVAMDTVPHDPCPQAAPPMQAMIGATLGRGWRQAIQQRLGGIQGCTHLRELLFNMATAAFQTLPVAMASRDGQPPPHLGQCLAWDFNGPVVQKVYPMFFQYPGRT